MEIFKLPFYLRTVSDRFNLSKSTAREYIYKILDLLIEKRNLFIKWPNEEGAHETSHYFERRNGFPDIIGYIGGSHIPISKPSLNQDSYVNRKEYHSLILQGVCDYRRKFIHVSCGWPGRVFRKSDLGDIINHPEFNYNEHLIGDSAYPLTPYLITPYRDNGHLTNIQKYFNRKLSSNRIRIEHAFGLLKGRFRCLQH
ncbi:hypothetical protein MML48_2g00010101 [Holotrichia oblita]|uniref:Uncharacterized protein n=1 Tax=Holotrichia oblita TaxID=644536 RepID=A0ACB9TMG5_HOLOL|nr:hypothetical protein MML48_2g00010101 [Holotrichia oblita]